MAARVCGRQAAAVLGRAFHGGGKACVGRAMLCAPAPSMLLRRAPPGGLQSAGALFRTMKRMHTVGGGGGANSGDGGDKTGHTDGDKTGHTDGAKTGHTDGAKTGHTDGAKTGHTDGAKTGHADGAKTGHTDGVKTGDISTALSPAGRLPCSYCPIYSRVVAEFGIREMGIISVEKQQGKIRIMQNRIRIDQSVIAENLTQWRDLLLRTKAELDARIEEIDKKDALRKEEEADLVELADFLAEVSEVLEDWGIELIALNEEQQKTAEVLTAREAAARDKLNADVVIVVEGVPLKVSEVRLTDAQNTRLKKVPSMYKTSDGEDGGEKQGSGNCGGEDERWYESYQRRYAKFYVSVKFWIGFILLFLMGNRSKEDYLLTACAVAEQLLDEWLEKPRKFWEQVNARVEKAKQAKEAEEAKKEE